VTKEAEYKNLRLFIPLAICIFQFIKVLNNLPDLVHKYTILILK